MVHAKAHKDISPPVNSDAPRKKRSKLEATVLVLLVVITLALYAPLNNGGNGATILVGTLDALIPVVPVMTLPYLVFLPVFCLVFLYALVSGRGFVRLALAVIIVCACSDFVYLLFQTYVPRPHIAGQGFFEQLLIGIYNNDQPFNDFPSEHASLATVVMLYVLWLRSKYWPVMAAFCVVVISATVLLKQHSLMGAAAGVVLALVTWFGISPLLSDERN